MTRQTSAIEVNKFVGGLITEASPLTFPPNASIDEQNFTLFKEGGRRRRLGVDFEDGFAEIVTSVQSVQASGVALQSFKWPNVGGDPTKNFVVIQVGNELYVLNSVAEVISNEMLFKYVVPNVPTTMEFSFTVVDGILVVATGRPDLLSISYNDGIFTPNSYRLLVRDLFGVEDVWNGSNLREGSGVSIRPRVLSDAHLYNLRNQTWGPTKAISSGSLGDTVEKYHGATSSNDKHYPSNADITTYATYPAAGGSMDRLHLRDIRENPIGSVEAPRGYFIIDALSRGESRLEQERLLRSLYPVNSLAVRNLPRDETPNGATLVAQFAGRVFYAGFSGEVLGGDLHSPRLSSYILFTKLVEDQSDLPMCYQEGDPTSKQEPDIIDTDGGFLRIDEAFGIKALVPVGSSLIIVASNGVWMLQGGSDYGFKATNYLLTKISNYGCVSGGSVVLADQAVLYWAEDGIYTIAKNQYGDFVVDNLSHSTIASYYSRIAVADKNYCSGTYDSYERKVYWTFKNRVESEEGVVQLVFDTTLGAFYPYVFPANRKFPMIHSTITVPPYRISYTNEDVTVLGQQVVSMGDEVFVREALNQAAVNETKYLIITSVSPTIKFTFGLLKDDNFQDFASTGMGEDAKAYLVTGHFTGGDTQRQKQTPYITFHFKKTESGYDVGEDGEYFPKNPSSCLVSSKWEWTNHRNSGKWSDPFQAYRFRRPYGVVTTNDDFDNGFELVTTKSKLRGRGKALSLVLESETGKDLYVLGWSMVVGVSSNV